jgi:V-type H+-transporting ATPase subunit H
VDPGRARLFHAIDVTGGGSPLDVYQILLRLLHRNDWFTQEKACLLLTEVLASRPDKAALRLGAPSAAQNGASSSSAAQAADEVQKAAATFIDWLCAQLRRPSHPARSVPTAVHALSRLLREQPLRAMLHRSGGVQLLAPLVAMPPAGNGQLNIQLLYEATLCTWELSFHRAAADVLCGSTNVVGALVDMVRQAKVGGRQQVVVSRCNQASPCPRAQRCAQLLPMPAGGAWLGLHRHPTASQVALLFLVPSCPF